MIEEVAFEILFLRREKCLVGEIISPKERLHLNTDMLQVTQEQADLVSNFLKALFGNNVEAYWSLISKVDQSRIYGMYIAVDVPENERISFYDYVKDYVKAEQEKIYQEISQLPGISNIIRFTEEGEVEIYAFGNVEEVEEYTTPTEKRTIPIVLTLDTHIVQGEITTHWKVRLYTDQSYKHL